MGLVIGVISLALVIGLIGLNLLGRSSFARCDLTSLNTDLAIQTSANNIGYKVTCEDDIQNRTVYCRWFFGPEGFLDLDPLHLNTLETLKYNGVYFVRSVSEITCQDSSLISQKQNQVEESEIGRAHV